MEKEKEMKSCSSSSSSSSTSDATTAGTSSSSSSWLCSSDLRRAQGQAQALVKNKGNVGGWWARAGVTAARWPASGLAAAIPTARPLTSGLWSAQRGCAARR